MRLAEYLKQNGLSRAAFAQQVGISGGLVTQLCNGGVWPGREVASRIKEVTEGAVTPDDFLPEQEVAS